MIAFVLIMALLQEGYSFCLDVVNFLAFLPTDGLIRDGNGSCLLEEEQRLSSGIIFT